MKIRIFPSILTLICYFTCISCGNGTSQEEKDISEAADSFATRYYTWKFKDAMKYSDVKCQAYLQFISSNVHEADLRILHESTETPEITIGKVNLKDNGDATAEIKLKNVYLMDTLGTTTHLYEKSTQILSLHRSGETWKVSSILTK